MASAEAVETARAHQRAFLAKQKERTEPIITTIEGIEVTINEGVFPPATDTKLLALAVHVGKGDRIIDMTTGSGVVAIVAGKQGATGIAVDINPLAVECARQNVARHGIDIEVIESNLFSNIPPEQFDRIYANGPFFDDEIEDPLDYACYGSHKFTEDLLAGAKARLKPDGKLLMVVSEFTDIKHLEQTAENKDLSAEVIETRSSSDGERVYLLYEIKLS